MNQNIEITLDHLKQAADIGKCFFSPREAGEMMDLPESVFLIPGTAIYKEYKTAWLQSEYDLRSNVLKLAAAGSSPAQAMALDILKSATIKTIK